MALRYSGDAFSYFDTPNEFRQPSSFRAMNNPDVYTAGILNPELLKYLEEEGGEIEKEDFDRFAPQSFFQKATSFAQRPDVRTGLGFLLGGIPGGILSFFAPKVGEGITSLFNRMKPAPTVTPMNVNDYTDAGSTTAFGQDVSSSDLTSITDDQGQDTGFSEYSDPGTAAEYEGSF